MTENEKQIEMNTDDPNPKTPYSAPQLVVHGDIWEITLTKKQGQKIDKPGQETLRTGFSQPSPSPTQTPR